MLRIDRKNQSFTLLETPRLADVSISERYDLQEFISNSPQAFFKELGLEVFLVGKEIMPSKSVQDRIDLLAVDKEGNSVIIELKRGNNKLQLLQAISYAGMMAQWTAEDLLRLLDESHQESLTDFLEVDIEEVNRAQRIVLIAEEFDYALLVGTEWLSKNYGVDVMCCRISVAKDAVSGIEYLVCSNVYPAPELFQEATPRGQRSSINTIVAWSNWSAALAEVTNPEMVAFYQGQLSENRESYLRKRILHYRIEGKRRWFVAARQSRAYVWQHGRFDNDIEYWKEGLSENASVKPVKRGRCLSFLLETKNEFAFFQKSVTDVLITTIWNDGVDEEDSEVDSDA
ncbi:MAG: hypothetical protein RLY14_201 [Planctomycetota bacterium]|jgi:hypothetical protein